MIPSSTPPAIQMMNAAMASETDTGSLSLIRSLTGLL